MEVKQFPLVNILGARIPEVCRPLEQMAPGINAAAPPRPLTGRLLCSLPVVLCHFGPPEPSPQPPLLWLLPPRASARTPCLEDHSRAARGDPRAKKGPQAERATLRLGHQISRTQGWGVAYTESFQHTHARPRRACGARGLFLGAMVNPSWSLDQLGEVGDTRVLAAPRRRLERRFSGTPKKETARMGRNALSGDSIWLGGARQTSKSPQSTSPK